MGVPVLPQDSVILFGSGVSMWSPSDIPTGAQVRDALLNLLFRDQIREWDLAGLRHWLNWIPFETINEFAPSSVNLDEFYSEHLSTSRPNELHKQLSKLAASRGVAALITTNYDCGVEAAAGASSPLFPVVEPSQPVPPGAIPLFKVHGCTTKPSTLVYRLNQEATLPKEKERYLHTLLAGRTLVAVGYSGIDFEICPAIAASQAVQVFWCYRTGSSPKEYETPGYQAIASRIPTIPIPVDLTAGLPWLTISTHVPLAPSPGRCIDTFFAAILTEDERVVWALRLASAVGYADLAQKLLALLLSKSSSDYILAECEKQQGFALFQSGRYRDAAKAFLRTAYSAKRIRNYEQVIHSLLDACDAWRAGGYHGRAVTTFLRAKIVAFSQNSPKIACRLAIKEALLLKSIAVALQPGTSTSRLSRIFRSLVSGLVHRRGRQLVACAQRHAAPAGQVFDQKQLEELESVFAPSTAPSTKAPDGYGHLGYFSAATTLFRTQALQPHLSAALVREAEERYMLMCQLGNHPEAWKVAARMAVISSGRAVDEWERRATRQQQLCQYARRHRDRLTAWVRSGATIEKSWR